MGSPGRRSGRRDAQRAGHPASGPGIDRVRRCRASVGVVRRQRWLGEAGARHMDVGGGTWTRHTTPAHPPSAGPMVYDPFNGTVIMIAMAENGRSQTWVWNSSTWRLLRPRSEINPRGAVGDLVADLADRTVVALVSCCGSGPPKSSQTWTWNGSTWSLRTREPDPPPSSWSPRSIPSQTRYSPSATMGPLVLRSPGRGMEARGRSSTPSRVRRSTH